MISPNLNMATFFFSDVLINFYCIWQVWLNCSFFWSLTVALLTLVVFVYNNVV